MLACLTLFGSALIAATLLPMQSEAVLVALLIAGDHPALMLLVVATTGNVLGALINRMLGRYMLRFQNKRWFPASEHGLERATRWYQRYGRWSLLASWVPVIGDPITVVAGVLREPLWSFLMLVTLAKAGRYAALVFVTAL